MTGLTDSRWGVLPWGMFLWGDFPDIDYQGAQAGAKADTLLYVTSADPDLDLSQMGTTLTTDSGAEYTTGATHLQGVADFTIEARCIFDNSDTGVIVWAASGSNTRDFRLELLSSGNVRFTYGWSGNTTQLDVTAPGVSGSEASYDIQAVVEPNPITTGSSDAVVVRLTVANGADLTDPGNYAQHQEFGPRDPTMNCNHFSVWGEWDGAAMGDVFSGAPSTIRFSARPHSFGEFRYDLLDSTTPATINGEHPPSLPRLTDDIGDEGYMAGPAYVMGGAHHRARRFSMAGPACFLGINEPPTIDADAANLGFPDEWIYTPANLPLDFPCSLAWIQSPPVPRWATHVIPKIRVSSNANSEAETTTEVAFFSANRNPASSPTSLGTTPSELRVNYSSVGWQHDSQDTTGAVLKPTPVRLSVGDDGHTWLFVGIHDETSGAEVVLEHVDVTFVHWEDVSTSPKGVMIP